VDLRLQLNVSSGQTQISVTGIAGDVRTDQPQLGTRLGEVEVQETPLLNRRLTALPLLNAANRPAINQGDIFMNQFSSPPTAADDVRPGLKSTVPMAAIAGDARPSFHPSRSSRWKR
jgi:hypothetical protein